MLKNSERQAEHFCCTGDKDADPGAGVMRFARKPSSEVDSGGGRVATAIIVRRSILGRAARRS